MKLTHIALAFGALAMLAAGTACGGATSTADDRGRQVRAKPGNRAHEGEYV